MPTSKERYDRLLAEIAHWRLMSTALEILPESSRDIFFRRIDGQKYAEIGDALGVSATTVRAIFQKVVDHIVTMLDSVPE